MKLTPPALKTALLLALSFPLRVSAAPADVEVVPPRAYTDVLLREVRAATSSITACLYLYAVNPARPGSEAMRIAEALAAAKARGVRVTVVLDAGKEWRGEESLEPGKNRAAYDHLSGLGLDVFFTTAPAVAHAKAVVFDEASVLLGSTNWSEAAFNRNVEANALIRGRRAARETLAVRAVTASKGRGLT